MNRAQRGILSTTLFALGMVCVVCMLALIGWSTWDAFHPLPPAVIPPGVLRALQDEERAQPDGERGAAHRHDDAGAASKWLGDVSSARARAPDLVGGSLAAVIVLGLPASLLIAAGLYVRAGGKPDAQGGNLT